MTALPAKNVSFEQLPRYRAPQRDRESLVAPPLSGLIERTQNHKATSGLPTGLKLGSWPLQGVREVARAEALSAAIAHTESYRDLWFDKRQYLAGSARATWLVAGHQPELFHPGVWFKNFLLSEAEKQTGSVALNLVIDNDLCRSPAIRVLTRGASGNEPLRSESVLFDAPTPAVAWECRPLADNALFDSFPERVRRALVNDVQQPLVEQLWQHARTAARRTGRLGLALAEARHALEGDLGLRTLELPLSRLCEQTSFARFSLELLRHLPRFQQIYNSQRAAYREANGIRSESHPVQALTERHGWLEAPWWVYRATTPARKRVFAMLSDGNLHLSDQAGWHAVIEGPLDEEDAVQQWQEFALDGVSLRPRALITTMFARLVISDLFVHGIGGGKYDQLTDAIIREFFAVEPPPMCVATATVQLPLTAETTGGTLAENRREIEREMDTLRRLRYHPEEHLVAPGAEVQQLLQAKQELLRAMPPRGEKWEWHRRITSINQRLVQLNQTAVHQSEERLHALTAKARELKVAYSRELSFCLFELPYVAETLSGLAKSEFDFPAAK